MRRLDTFPTHQYLGYKVRIGLPYPFGVTSVPDGLNFSIFSSNADFCKLLLFKKGEENPFIEIPFRGTFKYIESNEDVWVDFRIGHVYTITVFDLDREDLEYGYCMSRDGDNAKIGYPGLHRYDFDKILLDPYAKGIGGRDVWRKKTYKHSSYPLRARYVYDDFDWESDRPLEIPMNELVIYEMHVRGFTKHKSSEVKYPGTYSAINEKIPYLKDLGINCIELMPIFEFDEFEEYIDFWNSNPNATNLVNYWGYNTLGFFAPKSGYSCLGDLCDSTMVADELKTLIKNLHKNGIEVFLDVVFNHTGEGGIDGPVISFKGIDNSVFYLLKEDGHYENFTGTGNTFNCNNPIVRMFIIDCLRYWVSEYHIDGFRFDMAAILSRGESGSPLLNPPLLESIAYDPVLGKCKLIAEAWDASGLYQVGAFPNYSRWAEWNGKYRDTVRKYLSCYRGQIGCLADRIVGSSNIYSEKRGPMASVNFITCHDGFTLYDLFTYERKYNHANCEDNKDGENNNFGWNCGIEGETDNEHVNALRKQQIKNAFLLLFMSCGIPMIQMGDEMGFSKKGNNNSYCHDSEINWINWVLLKKNADIYAFVKNCINFRKKHYILRLNKYYWTSSAIEFKWHGLIPNAPDWSDSSKVLAYTIKKISENNETSDYIYVGFNMSDKDLVFELTANSNRQKWYLFADTGNSKNTIYPEGKEFLLKNQKTFVSKSYSSFVLVSK